jgi:hypothetical protein
MRSVQKTAGLLNSGHKIATGARVICDRDVFVIPVGGSDVVADDSWAFLVRCNENEGEGDDCREARVKGITVMEGIVRMT